MVDVSRLIENDIKVSVILSSRVLNLSYTVVSCVGDEFKPNVVQLFQSFQKLRDFLLRLREGLQKFETRVDLDADLIDLIEDSGAKIKVFWKQLKKLELVYSSHASPPHIGSRLIAMNIRGERTWTKNKQLITVLIYVKVLQSRVYDCFPRVGEGRSCF